LRRIKEAKDKLKILDELDNKLAKIPNGSILGKDYTQFFNQL
jgi:hypothetical protein